jgi:hypothetical protein
VGARISGTVDLVAEAADTEVIQAPAPWNDKPLTPALVEWRLVAGGVSSAWHVAVDFRTVLPAVGFHSVYAAWTRQNHPRSTGRYRFYLARAFDTRSLPDGRYRLQVRAVDVSGNSARASRALTVANAAV